MFGINGKLKKIKKDASPSQAFKSSLQKQLKYEMENKYMIKASIITRYATVGITSLALVFSAGTGVYAYESPDVVEGHPLEIVKESIEKVEEHVAGIRNSKPKFHAKMLNRRLAEAKRHEMIPNKTHGLLLRVSDELGITMQELREGINNDETQQELIDELVEVNEKYGYLLDRLINKINTDEPDLLKRRIRLHNAGLGDEVRAIRDELHDSQLDNDERRDFFRERMHDLMMHNKEKAMKLRNQLIDEGLEIDDVRRRISDEFHPVIRDIDLEIQKLNPDELDRRFFHEFTVEMKKEGHEDGETDDVSEEDKRMHLRAEMRRRLHNAGGIEVYPRFIGDHIEAVVPMHEFEAIEGTNNHVEIGTDQIPEFIPGFIFDEIPVDRFNDRVDMYEIDVSEDEDLPTINTSLIDEFDE